MTRRSRFRSLLCVWLAATIGVGGCRAPQTQTAPVKQPPPRVTPVGADDAPLGRPQIPVEPDDAGRITMRTTDPKVASANAVVANLSEAETAALHARMEPLPAIDNSQAPIVRPPSAAPASSAGQPIAFVVPTGKAVSDAPIAAGKVTTPLQSPQITPAGEVRAESEIRVRFSEPMVPVAQVGSNATPNIAIKPAVTGTWKWIDSRVVQFTAVPRFPQATKFEVTVPAGVEALSGAKLQTAATQQFETPPIRITGTFPANQLRPDAPLAVRFDHDADLAALLPKLHVRHGTREIAVKPIERDAAMALWARDPSKKLVDLDLLPKRHAILVPVTGNWPAGASLDIRLDKGAPSAEGPKLSTEVSRAGVEIVQAFALRGIECQQNPNTYEETKPRLAGARCPADAWFNVTFSNAIAEKTYRASKVQLSGEEFQDNSPHGGASIGLATPPRVGRGYTVLVGDGIEDIYGQPLVGARSASFVTGPVQYYAGLSAPSGLHVLDPRFEVPQWVVQATAVSSVRVQLYRVTPSDYFAFQSFETDPKKPIPGKKIFDQTNVVGPTYRGQQRVDLRAALTNGFGHVVAVATAVPAPGNPPLGRVTAWIEVTHLGATARVDAEKITAFIHDLSPVNGFLAPRGNVDAALVIEGQGERNRATSDATGQVSIELLDRQPLKPGQQPPTVLLRMSAGDDSAFSVIHRTDKTQRVNDALWYVTDDRFTYKPGEPVYLKGWVRWTHNGPNPKLELPRSGETVTWTLNDGRGAKIANGVAPLTEQGGFDLEVALPANVNLGQASFFLTTRGDAIRHPISIQEFRTPAYAVTLDDDVSHRGSIPLVVGESIEMLASAKYYAGGGLGGAAIDWNATLTTTTYSPPGWSQYEFSPPIPRSQRYWYYRSYESRSTSASQTGSLSGASTASVTWGIPATPGNWPSVLTVDSTVTDVDRMTIRASSRPILVHPSMYYVGLRLKPLSSSEVEAIVTDIDGNVVKGVAIDIAIDSVLGSERNRNDAKVIATQPCKLVSAATPVVCKFDRTWEHAYTATAKVTDARGRVNVADLDLPWRGRDDKKQLELVPDKPLYRAGDTAKIEIKSALVPSRAIVTFARQGVIEQKRIELTAASTMIEIPITLDHIKNLYVQVDRYGKKQSQGGPADDRSLPEVVSAEVKLDVDLESARLDVRAKPSAKLIQPGDEATFDLDVQQDGKPVAGAEVALIVVDEAILALSNGTHADPLKPFYRDVASGTWAWNTFGMVHDSGFDVDGKPGYERIGLGGGGTGWGTIGSGRYGTIGHGAGGGGGYGMGSMVVTARKDFRPTAVFSPTLITDVHGHAKVTVKMPDSLTRFRIVALATAKTHYFGKGESTIITQRKVNARTIAPRFLTQGDRFSLPVLVQNLDTKPRTIEVAVRAANLVAAGPQGKRVTIPGGQRAEVRFDFATQQRGKVVIQTIMTSGPYADASNVELPVYVPATTESFATYGVVDEQAQREQLAIPKDVFAEVGGVEVEVASTQMQALTDAYWYLQAYPYECAEQRSSRMLATSSLYDILDAFATPGRPSRDELEAQRNRDVALLTKTQRPDGGWGYFTGMKSDPMVSLQVLAALAASKATGAVIKNATAFATKELATVFGRLQKRVATVDRNPSAEDAYSISLAAHVLVNLAATGQDMRPRAEKLHAIATTLKVYPVDAKARVLSILAKYEPAKAVRAKLVTDLTNAIHETAGAATVATEYVEAERLLLVSSVKSNALVLDALIKEQPDQPVIQKLARGVLESRKHGRWTTTQENLFSLQAMRRFFDVYEKATPNYTGKLWLGKTGYAEQAFVGRTTARGVAQASWTTLAPGTTHDLVFSRDGAAGRMYYRVGITYAPKQVDLPALDAGFIVRRSYSAVEDPSDVIKQADGSYKIKLGAKVVVTIETTNTTTRNAVAVVDPMPAGFEAVNTALATSERAAAVSSDSWDYQNLRDNRAEAFDMELPAGVHRYAYTVRATTPGVFIAAPAKAEEMYAPETFGRSNGTKVTVE